LTGYPTAHPTPEDVYGSWSATASPDGERVAFVSDRSGLPSVWICGPRPGERAGEPAMVRLVPLRVLTVSWSPDGAWLACWTAAAGSTRNEVWLVRPDGSDLHLAAGAEPSSALLGAGAWHGWTAAGQLMLTETTGLVCTALLVDPRTGHRRTIVTGPMLVLLDLSRDTRRALLRTGSRGARRLVVHDAAGERPVVTGVGPGSVDRGFLAADGHSVYARSEVGRELAALVRVDLDGTAAPTVVAERAGADLEDVVPAGDGDSAVLVWNVHGGTSAVSLLRVATGRQDPITVPRSVVDECRLRPDGKALLLTAEDWADPRGVWTIDLATGEATPVSSRADGALRASLGASTAMVDTADLTRPRLLRLLADDGLELTGWLYRPQGPGPWPTLIYLHGGPEAQERPVYNSLFQSLVAAGVAVFAPNVRGSSGFGRTFGAADDREKRYAGIADVASCVRYVVETGVAVPGRVGCMGRSYGGYLTLAALTWYPRLFAVGVDVCGMADFETFYAGTEPRIAVAAVSKYGDPVLDAALLRDLSPIHRMDQLIAPLLIVHGAEDTNVPVGQAEQVAAALAARGVEHRLMIFSGEGHELLATPNRVAFVRATVAWVVEHLG
jgi:dipeptidyl aminopeptidase/acylaminoacyl peptidase